MSTPAGSPDRPRIARSCARRARWARACRSTTTPRTRSTRAPMRTPPCARGARRCTPAECEQLATATPSPALMDDGTGRPAVDIWVLGPNMAQAAAPYLPAVRAAGGQDLVVHGGRLGSRGTYLDDGRAAHQRAHPARIPGSRTRRDGHPLLAHRRLRQWRSVGDRADAGRPRGLLPRRRSTRLSRRARRCRRRLAVPAAQGPARR